MVKVRERAQREKDSIGAHSKYSCQARARVKERTQREKDSIEAHSKYSCQARAKVKERVATIVARRGTSRGNAPKALGKAKGSSPK